VTFIRNEVLSDICNSFGKLKCNLYEAYYMQMWNTSISRSWFNARSMEDDLKGYRNTPELANFGKTFMSKLDLTFKDQFTSALSFEKYNVK
jgi:hypothetical protein